MYFEGTRTSIVTLGTGDTAGIFEVRVGYKDKTESNSGARPVRRGSSIFSEPICSEFDDDEMDTVACWSRLKSLRARADRCRKKSDLSLFSWSA